MTELKIQRFERSIVLNRLRLTRTDGQVLEVGASQFLVFLEDLENTAYGFSHILIDDPKERQFLEDLGVINTCSRGSSYRGSNYEAFYEQIREHIYAPVSEPSKPSVLATLQNPDADVSLLADDVYQVFCEDHGSGELQDAWDEYEAQHGEIESGSLIDRLVHAAMKYTVQQIQIRISNGE